ncbi:MAG: deoxyguanosinetriphosphate triphosphohydrolase [Firmicutes bacterium]|nr:deoxyguanosinetriphosphate triphosphohydrolase [Bacillota bacterium]
MSFINELHTREKDTLSQFATLSSMAVRVKSQKSDNLRLEFSRDRDRILHSKAFRRLKHKTQVFISPDGDHYRTRLTHTLEVSAIARTIARALRLNEDLTEAIALAHDLGHTPYGHAGERALNQFTPFSHAEQGLRVVDFLEGDGVGINLTVQVRDGILNHTSKGNPSTLEGQIVSWADRIAYINHDIDDALRAGVLKINDIPKRFLSEFGDRHSKRINSMILDVIEFSSGKDKVSPSSKFLKLIAELRQFMFDKVYISSNEAKLEEHKAVSVVAFLYAYFYKNLQLLPKYILDLEVADEQKVCDYISMMTDRFAVAKFEELSIPKGWAKL